MFQDIFSLREGVFFTVESQITHSDVLQNRWGIKRLLLITEMTEQIEKMTNAV